MTMLYSSGCRISEITNLKLSDFLDDYHSAIVTGKGNKQRRVYFASESRNALKVYLEDRKKMILDKGIENPQKVQANSVENVPVRFTDKGESVRIAAE